MATTRYWTAPSAFLVLISSVLRVAAISVPRLCRSCQIGASISRKPFSNSSTCSVPTFSTIPMVCIVSPQRLHHAYMMPRDRGPRLSRITSHNISLRKRKGGGVNRDQWMSPSCQEVDGGQAHAGLLCATENLAEVAGQVGRPDRCDRDARRGWW